MGSENPGNAAGTQLPAVRAKKYPVAKACSSAPKASKLGGKKVEQKPREPKKKALGGKAGAK